MSIAASPQRHNLHILLIILIGLITYSNSFDVPFHSDDRSFIKENSGVKDPSKIQLLQNRSVGFLSFALNYKINGFHVWGYHAINVAIHLLNAVLVYLLVINTFKTPFFDGSRFENDTGLQSGAAFLAGLLFVAHPIQTSAVTYLWQRITSLATLFYLFSLVLYVLWRLETQRTTDRKETEGAGYKQAGLYMASLISAILAMKTKEISFTLPLAIVMYEFLFMRSPGGSIHHKPARKQLLYLLPFLLCMLIIPLGLLGPKLGLFHYAGEIDEKIRQDQLRDIETISRSAYFMTQLRVIVTYLRLLILPVNQSAEYDFPLYTSLLDPNVWLSLVLLASLFTAGVLLYRKASTTRWVIMISFGIFWFFLTLSVESSIIPIRTLINEQRVYLPSVGAFIAVGTGLIFSAPTILRKFNRPASPSLVYVPVLLIAAVLSVASYARNQIGRDEMLLWQDVAMKAPKKAGAHLGLGIAHRNRGMLTQAITEFKTAAQIAASGTDLYVTEKERLIILYNLGLACYEAGRYDEAIAATAEALKLRPAAYILHNLQGLALLAKQAYNEALAEFSLAASLRPEDAEIRYNIGRVFHARGMLKEALDKYNMAMRLNPSFDKAHCSAGLVYASLGKAGAAASAYADAVKANPLYTEAHLKLGDLHLQGGRFDEAIASYLMAARSKPDLPETYYSLGMAYLAKGSYKDAAMAFQMTLKLSPGHVQARRQLDALPRGGQK
jgi:tetratricopeptide (TPR) repeat protein